MKIDVSGLSCRGSLYGRDSVIRYFGAFQDSTQCKHM